MAKEQREVERLMAYADGELEPADSEAVERQLADDAEARRLVVLFLQQPGLLKAALAGVLAPAGVEAAANANLARRRTAYRAAAAVALLLGGVAAGWLGAEMRIRAETGDRIAAVAAAMEAQQTALNAALERNSNGEAGQWVSADGGAHGTITPLMTFVNEEGSFCREVEQDFSVEGQNRTALGLACRVGDGQWQVRYWLFENPETLPGMAL